MSRGPRNRSDTPNRQQQAGARSKPTNGTVTGDWGNTREKPSDDDISSIRKRWWHVGEPLPLIVNVLTLIAVGIYTAYAIAQVGATHEANTIAKQSLIQTNRPYVMWSGFSSARLKDSAGEHFHISPVFTNWGNTPAEGVTFYNCDPLIRSDLSVPSFNCTVSEREHPATSIGPKQPTTFLGPIISKEDLIATQTEKKVIYVFGYIYYKDYVDLDMNGQPATRLTEYCQRIAQVAPPPNAASLPSETLTIAGLGCPDFSCSDYACRYRPPH